ncbi:uncharacterized protein B0J16DRAFT_345809 [Fusarium flagelliforme]|uniref:uncharacterized protein n=1 Tax=Fusarium flagelliforme TaxID=2675880 RepID=UPI001E8EC50D|nr:uncharacterized protein B0J16DRAFT_345809 [Fusarium flagelliforme]KAH7183446.1 hypothetical protein B0J16DRAFT_345809 [Fusarium flagelliforme]
MAPTIIVGLILGCALLGGYTSMFTSHQHGFFDAIRVCNTGAKSCALDMTDSVSRRITGFEQVDAMINLLLEFFSQGLRKSPDTEGMDLEALVAFVYLAAQFGGAWYLIALEGLRVGNKGTILSWTGTFGIVFQAVTITIIAPIYLTLQLLLSPSNPRQAHLLVDPADLNFLPVATIISYVLPTIGLCLPLVFDISREAKFIAVALWQPFPLYQSALQSLWRLFNRDENNNRHAILRQTKALDRTYSFVTGLTVIVHFLVMGTIAASWLGLVQPVSGHHILALTSIADPPTMALFDPPVSAMESREIVVSFLRWDVYCTCLSMVIWSGYQLYAVQGAPSAVVIVVKAILMALVGGPIFPALMFLWKRDSIVMSRTEVTTAKKHK